MTDRLVTLAVWILAACFALACAAYAWRAAFPPASQPSTASTSGEPAWQAHCARCHTASEFTAPLARPDRAATAGRWLVDLERHGRASFAEDVAILHWLALQAAHHDGAAEASEPEAPEEEDFSL